MKVIHYKRNAESGEHVHAGAYASCFFVPDKQVVIFAEQEGSFGGVIYSITDREAMLREAQLIANGEIPEIDLISFSDIKDFEYDDHKIKELIDDAKSAKELEARTKSSIEQLLEAVKGDTIEEKREYLEINPATLDRATLERLKALVARTDNEYCRESFYDKLKPTTGTPQERGELILKEFRQVADRADLGGLLTKYKSIEEGIVDDSYKAELREMVYKTAQKRRRYDVMRIVGLELGKDEKQVEAEITARRNERLEEIILEPWELEGERTQYIPAVREAAKDIPRELVYKTVKTIYAGLMVIGDGPQRRSSRADAQNPIKAALLAKEYLGNEKLAEAGKAAVKSIVEAKSEWNINKKYYGVVDSLELPDDIAHPVMLYFFNASLEDHSMDPVAIAKKHNLTDAEIRGGVNKSYGEFLQRGYFQGALRMRELFDDLVEDKSILVEDLRTVVGVLNYRQGA